MQCDEEDMFDIIIYIIIIYHCYSDNLIALIYIALGQCSVMMRIRLIYKLGYFGH